MLERILKRFLIAVKSSCKYPGAVYVAYKSLACLGHLYRRNATRFTPAILQQIQSHKNMLPLGVKAIDCPACFGSGTQRWMKSYKHKCNRCGG
jgi:hypothetical protein